MRTFGLMVLVVAAVVRCWCAAPFLMPGDDDGLGTGLMAFAILGTVASVVGLWDGLHEHRLPRVLARALLTGALAGRPRILERRGKRPGPDLHDDLLSRPGEGI